jgi:aspartate/methionine/tyrosine aminotransferase
LSYPTKTGDHELKLKIQKLIKNEYGIYFPTPPTIFITNSATHSILLLLKFFRHQTIFKTWPPAILFHKPCFTHYFNFARNSEFEILETPIRPFVQMIDIVANPTGENRTKFDSDLTHFNIIDATYHNTVYNQFNDYNAGYNDYVVGSLGKITGINGMRLGFIAISNQESSKELEKLIYQETLGVSSFSQAVCYEILSNTNYIFFEEARMHLDDNRNEMEKLSYLANSSVNPNGMFYWTQMDQAAQKLLSSVNVNWIKGSDCGADDSFVRLNLAQTRQNTKNMVKAVLKKDKK